VTSKGLQAWLCNPSLRIFRHVIHTHGHLKQQVRYKYLTLSLPQRQHMPSLFFRRICHMDGFCRFFNNNNNNNNNINNDNDNNNNNDDDKYIDNYTINNNYYHTSRFGNIYYYYNTNNK
jgi:hypothetical protein